MGFSLCGGVVGAYARSVPTTCDVACESHCFKQSDSNMRIAWDHRGTELPAMQNEGSGRKLEEGNREEQGCRESAEFIGTSQTETAKRSGA